MAKIEQDELRGVDRRRHFKKRRLLVRELVKEAIVKLRHVPTTVMIADILTKPLQGNLFRRLRGAMLNCGTCETLGAMRSSQGGVSTNIRSRVVIGSTHRA